MMKILVEEVLAALSSRISRRHLNLVKAPSNAAQNRPPLLLTFDPWNFVKAHVRMIHEGEFSLQMRVAFLGETQVTDESSLGSIAAMTLI